MGSKASRKLALQKTDEVTVVNSTNIAVSVSTTVVKEEGEDVTVTVAQTLFQSLTISTPLPSPKVSEPELSESVQKFVEKLRTAERVIVLVGAGASVAAGIPDFRTPGTGLYSQLEEYKLPSPEAIFSLSYFEKNPAPFRKLAAEMWPGGKYKPTLAHYFIKLLHDKNKLLRVFTQNIDSLEHETGLAKDMIVAAHGNFDSATCVHTGKTVPIEETRAAYLANDFTALNKKHGTKLVKPDIVFFGESLPQRFFEREALDFPQCDLLLVMGTSLKVEPFASLIEGPKRNVPRMLINREVVGTWRDGGFDFRKNTRDCLLKGDCDAGCLTLATALGWREELGALLPADHMSKF